MKEWNQSQREIRKVKQDLEMARSILKMVEIRIKAVKMLNKEEFASLVIEDYYEIIKEIITALIAVDGYKTLSHEVLIGFLKEFYDEFPESEILFIDQLRQLRNKIVYKGFFIESDYLNRNQDKIKEIVNKLKEILVSKLK
tara:strand:- start:19762 stop:20184 length:423 start_codon:yes stop_codon:yes gene_type:complete